MESVGNLFTGQTAVGVEVTGVRIQARRGNRRILPSNANRKMRANTLASMKVGMYMVGAEESVVVEMLL